MTPALFALAMLAPGSAGAASSAEGSLTPQLEALSAPEVAEASPEAQAEAIGVPAEGAGSLSREGERVVVEAHFEAGALARLEALEAAGAKVLVASRRYQTVALSVEPADLEAVAAVPGVDVVEPSLRPVVYGTEGEAINADPENTTADPAATAGAEATTADPATTAGAEATTSTSGPNATCEGGSVVSKGYEQLNVKEAREVFGARGRGITVGVLSDSFDAATTNEEGSAAIATKAATDEVTNDLPGLNSTCSNQQVAVRVLAEGKPSAGEPVYDEGRAMLQVVHDLAPHAQLAFATAYGSELEFAHNIERLAAPVSSEGAGAKVIVDDVAYYTEPFFQEGPVAEAIRRVTEEGVTYLTAAGNDNLFEIENGHETDREIASWERAEFADTTCPSALASRVKSGAYSCLNFSPSTVGGDPTFGITVEPGARLVVDLQWAEPWYGVKSDLDAYLLGPGNTVLAPTAGLRPLDNIDEGGGEGGIEFSAPVEVIAWKNTSASAVEVQLVVDRCIGLTCNAAADATAMPRVKVGLLENGSGVRSTQYHESEASAGITVGPTIYGHAASAAAITVGALSYKQSAKSPSAPEKYSSRGPATNYFGPVDVNAPAAPLEPPEVVEKPDITATDCAATTFFSALETKTGTWRFCGTSEAAPHAAAVAALMRQAKPEATPAEIGAAMESSATPFKVEAPNAVGAGLLDAAGAITALGGHAVTDPASIRVEPGQEERPTEGGTGKGGSGTEPEGEKGETPSQRPTPTPEPTPTPLPAPVVAVTKGPAVVDNEARPTFEFSASQPASFSCQIDGAAPQPCSSPYVAPSALGDGEHGFAVVATDVEGRSGASNTYYFTVDTKAPRARIVGHPAKLVKTRKARYAAHFRLTADQSPVTYYCQVDREPQRVCGARVTLRVKPGSHVLKVTAKDALGNASVSPSTYRFKVKKVKARKVKLKKPGRSAPRHGRRSGG